MTNQIMSSLLEAQSGIDETTEVKKVIALVYTDDIATRLDSARRALSTRFIIKKEVSAFAKTFDFSMVDLVVGVTNNQRSSRWRKALKAADAANKTFIFLSPQVSRYGWDKLPNDTGKAWSEALGEAADFKISDGEHANGSNTVAIALSPLETETEMLVNTAADAASKELVALYKRELTETKVHAQKLAGELGNVRHEIEVYKRERNEAQRERDAARSEKKKISEEWTRTQDANKVAITQALKRQQEADTQAKAWAERLKKLESEHKAALDQNARLVKERDADRAMLEEALTVATEPGVPREEYEKLKAERDDFMKKANLHGANTQNSVKANERLRSENASLQKRLAVVEKRVSLPSEDGSCTRGQIAEAVQALQTLVKTRIMTAEDALAKLEGMLNG